MVHHSIKLGIVFLSSFKSQYYKIIQNKTRFLSSVLIFCSSSTTFLFSIYTIIVYCNWSISFLLIPYYTMILVVCQVTTDFTNCQISISLSVSLKYKTSFENSYKGEIRKLTFWFLTFQK